MSPAPVMELADMAVSKTAAPKACRFESCREHHFKERSDAMQAYVNIGGGNLADTRHILAILQFGPAPSRRLLKAHKEAGTYIDATAGKSLRSLLFMDGAILVGSPITPATIAFRSRAQTEIESEADVP